MKFNKHKDLEDCHAFLSPSKYYWSDYDYEKLEKAYRTFNAAERGTRLHAFAKEAIELGIRPMKIKKTINMYINDAITYGMTPEQVLYYSDLCFGTADAIGFNKRLLRIHDLKTGTSHASMRQLEIYAALFCLEYGMSPFDIDFALRIYQKDDIIAKDPTSEEIASLMETIVNFDEFIHQLDMEER